MRGSRPAAAVIAPAATLLAVTACVPREVPMHPTPSPREDASLASGLTADRAKQRAIGIDERIEGALPRSGRTGTRIDVEGTVMGCSELSEQWAGGLTITFATPLDADVVLSAVEHEFDDTGRWEIIRDTTRRGTPRLSLGGAYGEIYFITVPSKFTKIDVQSFSPCYLSPPWPPAE